MHHRSARWHPKCGARCATLRASCDRGPPVQRAVPSAPGTAQPSDPPAKRPRLRARPAIPPPSAGRPHSSRHRCLLPFANSSATTTPIRSALHHRFPFTAPSATGSRPPRPSPPVPVHRTLRRRRPFAAASATSPGSPRPRPEFPRSMTTGWGRWSLRRVVSEHPPLGPTIGLAKRKRPCHRGGHGRSWCGDTGLVGNVGCVTVDGGGPVGCRCVGWSPVRPTSRRVDGSTYRSPVARSNS